MSRGQVREALAILEAMQLIERRAKSGIYLNEDAGGIETMAFFARAGIPLEARQIYEAVEVRKIHEIKAAELAAERATEENFERLRDILARSEARLDEGQGLERLDQEFHLEIVRATQNTVFLSDLHDVLRARRGPAAGLFPQARAEPAEPCRAPADLRGAGRRATAMLAQALMISHLRRRMSYWTELLEPGDCGALSGGPVRSSRRIRCTPR